ncbi:MAG: FeoA family protein [Candidatus Helarchaeota archaeon]
MKEISLSQVKPGDKGKISKIAGDIKYRERVLDLGITRGTLIEIVRNAPLGDPVEFIIRGYKLSLRKEEAKDIYVILEE